MENKSKTLCLSLYKVGALKFGDFKMKVGINSPVYFDLRIMVSYPDIMGLLADLLWEFAKSQGVDCNVICGVPYTALPLATLIAVNAKVPMLIRRKEPKDYGTKKLIEGVFKKGDLCVIIEDVVTTGSSILETVNDLKKEGLEVKNTIVVLDREQGGIGNLNKHGITMRPLLTLTQVLKYLREEDLIDDTIITKIQNYVKENQLDSRGESIKTVKVSRQEMKFCVRAKLAANPAAELLLRLMAEKQSILCVAADVTDTAQLLSLAAAVGPHIAVLKTHRDIVTDWSPDTEHQLTLLAKQHNFLIMEDRKFGDIGHTVGLQYSLVVSWAHLVTVHGLPGDAVLDAIEAVARKQTEPRGVFLVAQLSSAGNLITPQYTKSVMRQAASRPELVAGLVCQSSDCVTTPGLLQLTPGVSLSAKGDQLGQQYNSPHSVVCEHGADLAVVGRGITSAENPAAAAKQYNTVMWQSYLDRLKK